MQLRTLTMAAAILLSSSLVSLAGNGETDPKTEMVEKVGTNVGDQAPDLEFNGPDGKLVKLSDFRGKVVLIDFWASWCRPCRMENPNIVNAYNKFKKHKKGFEIVGVSLDKNKDRWIGAIKADNLTFPQMSDLGGWQSKPALLYHVQSIPTNFLLDENGVILAKNLRGANLEATLTKVLNQ